ncbi:chromatin/chromatin-binding, or -regulatory protein [Lithospermum erythrorhizon]|uniref:Chromatin/chromatin-binding, or -regulatory protein n=1 Tax=Lithospermum erythrorhizon TaxID=34254 RepID=A0AAV3NVQ0_LITER
MSDHKEQSKNSDLASATGGLSIEDHQDLCNATKSKLQDLSGDYEDFLNTLSPDVRQRVIFLRKIQNQQDELEAKYFEQRAALEAKYQQLYEPLYLTRYEVVNGVTEVEGTTYESTTDEDTNNSAGKGVPHFWLTAMKNNEILSEEITERDEGALQFLKDIKWSRLEDSKGFKLEFLFDPNPYFKNSVLTKTYHMISEEEHILEKATGTEIEWLPGNNLTQKVLKKKPKNGSKASLPVTRVEVCASFFNFFYPPEVPEDENEIDEETVELLQSQMEQDYNIGSTIKERIIPHAVSWFTGEAASDDEEVTDADDEDEENNEEYDTEEDEENEESDEKTTKEV